MAIWNDKSHWKEVLENIFAWYPNLITIKHPEFADSRNVSKQIFSRWTRINRDVIGRMAGMGNIPKWTNFSGWWISRNQPHTYIHYITLHTYIILHTHVATLHTLHYYILCMLHAYTDTYVRTYVRTYVLATLHTLHYYIICMLHAYTDRYVRTYVRTHTQTYKHTNIQAYKHTNIHSFLYTYITTLLHYYSTTVLHYYITTLLHYYITTLLHYFITTLHAFMHAYIHTYVHYIHFIPCITYINYISLPCTLPCTLPCILHYITYRLGCSSTTFLEGLFRAYISLCAILIFHFALPLKKKTSWYKLYLYQATSQYTCWIRQDQTSFYT